MEKETKLIECKTCKQTYTAILAKAYTKTKKWVDENGKQFNGRMCPKCHIVRVGKDTRSKKTVKSVDAA